MNIEVQDKIKVLIEGYSAEGHTSFGSQIRDLWKRMVNIGRYEVIQHGWFHSAHIEKVPWQIIPTNNSWNDQGQPTFMSEDKWGQKSFVRVCQQTKPHLVWTLADIYMIDHLSGLRRQMDYKYIQYMPVDGSPTPKRYASLINEADLSVGVCKWGAEIMSKLSGREVPYVFHGVDTDVFHPYSAERKAEIREAATQGKAKKSSLIIGWVGKDQTRKQPWNLFETLYYMVSGDYVKCNKCNRVTRSKYDKQDKKSLGLPTKCKYCYSNNLKKGTPIDTYLWCHAYNQPGQAWDFNLLIETWGLEDRVIFTSTLSRDKGLNTNEIVDLYNCFDVFVSFSGGEGFCIPLIEAQACGIPVLYADYSGQVEICTEGGLAVEVECLVPEPMTHIDRCVTSIDDAILKLNTLHSDKQLSKRLSNRGRVKMIDDFGWDDLAQQWDQLIVKTMQDSVKLIGVPS